jgi:hypothetical protein
MKNQCYALQFLQKRDKLKGQNGRKEYTVWNGVLCPNSNVPSATREYVVEVI